MPTLAHRAVLGAILALSLIGTACGGSDGGSASPTAAPAKGSVTMAGFNFPESSILANVYGKALKADGWTVTFKLNLGNREVVEPALERGDIDLYPGYAATELEFINKGLVKAGKPGLGEASTDPRAVLAKLNPYLKEKGLKALDPAPAEDQNAFAVLKPTADKYGLKTLSDLARVSDKLVLGGPPECPTRPFCQAGLDRVYGTKFKAFKPLDSGGSITKSALDKGDVDVALLFSSDGSISAKGYVVLTDDKHLQNADNVTPVVRIQTVKDDAQRLLNSVSAKLTTADLIQMNRRADADKQDPEQIAADWLKSHGFKAG